MDLQPVPGAQQPPSNASHVKPATSKVPEPAQVPSTPKGTIRSMGNSSVSPSVSPARPAPSLVGVTPISKKPQTAHRAQAGTRVADAGTRAINTQRIHLAPAGAGYRTAPWEVRLHVDVFFVLLPSSALHGLLLTSLSLSPSSVSSAVMTFSQPCSGPWSIDYW